MELNYRAPILKNKLGCDKTCLKGERAKFEREIKCWIKKGIFALCDKDMKIGVLPLMAVVQPTKNTVRSILNYRELNKYITYHSYEDAIDVCEETLRKWRQMTGASKIVNLKSTCLQIHIARHEQTYCLTQLGFGLNVAPKILSAILKAVLKQKDNMREGTDSYINDVLVDEITVPASNFVNYLDNFNLTEKLLKSLEGTAALGLGLTTIG